ncbi:MAG TPA: D-cysteine desulfhydrase family protein [Planctomycetota bacterium]|nr:D-cysteine desulfhydrase family protein [Planctomycetota bacterium]
MKPPPRVPLARLPTPLEPLDRLSDHWGGPRIFVKRDDLTGSTLTGNKVRKLEFCLGEAVALGAKRVATCGGIQSNHCRATAVACAQLGIACTLFLRSEGAPGAADGNHLLDVLVGADVNFVTPEEYRALTPPADAYWIPEGASNEVGMWGYVQACEELRERKFAALVHAVGSGGTTAGLVAGKVLFDVEAALVGVCVCDDAAFFYGKIEAILRAAAMRWKGLGKLPHVPAMVEIVDGFVGKGYAKNRPEEWRLLREVAEIEGLILDPVYTVKAMLALRQMIRDGRFTKGQDVCFLHTGGIFGLFPKRAEAVAG